MGRILLAVLPMERDEVRAVGLGLAIAYCWHARVELRIILHLADRFTAYIDSGRWPKEAVISYAEGEERKVPDAPVVEQAREARQRKPSRRARQAPVAGLLCGLCETRPAFSWPGGQTICRECAEKYFPTEVADWDARYGENTHG
jgi:hypothetical protein